MATVTRQFGRAMHDLNIDSICANSPAARCRARRARAARPGRARPQESDIGRAVRRQDGQAAAELTYSTLAEGCLGSSYSR